MFHVNISDFIDKCKNARQFRATIRRPAASSGGDEHGVEAKGVYLALVMEDFSSAAEGSSEIRKKAQPGKGYREFDRMANSAFSPWENRRFFSITEAARAMMLSTEGSDGAENVLVGDGIPALR
ncbi:MAG: hypothetical protein ISN28_10150 [Ectothiorhodospiraceae bacterium AqS1]|nr:hypothetical protein [Ectothiorhodospiraceae bacterium AqS1]